MPAPLFFIGNFRVCRVRIRGIEISGTGGDIGEWLLRGSRREGDYWGLPGPACDCGVLPKGRGQPESSGLWCLEAWVCRPSGEIGACGGIGFLWDRAGCRQVCAVGIGCPENRFEAGRIFKSCFYRGSEPGAGRMPGRKKEENMIKGNGDFLRNPRSRLALINLNL